MAILITGTAGFIGYHTAKRLLERGEKVIGIDNLNSYYDVKLKEARLAQLTASPHFQFVKMDIAEKDATKKLGALAGVTHVIHLAAQAGVRYSLQHPHAYIEANITGLLNLLEFARAHGKLQHFVYASSSSVYGGNTKVPFSVNDDVSSPVSLYAATKRSGELMARTYSHLFKIPATGLRFFTVYGPWGRPDMAAFLFARNILAGQPIAVFNHGQMQRDFTYIDDIVDGILGALAKPQAYKDGDAHKIYNLGNSHPEKLTDFIALIEKALDKKASYDFQPLQAGDVPATFADIEESTADFGFSPKVNLEEGIGRFISWYRSYHGV